MAFLETDNSPVYLGSNGYCGNGAFGNDWAWIVILLIFGYGGYGGFGRGGFGSYGGSSIGAMDNYVLTSDFATLQRQIDSSRASTETKLDSIANGICSLGYDQLAQMNNINTNIMQNGYETRLAVNGLGTQLQNCCCDLRAGQKDILYGIANQTNSLQNTMCFNTRDIIENQNANYRAIHDELVANKIEAKNDIIDAQRNEINALRLKASQEAQNNYLVDKLGFQCPKPAFLTCNPYTGQTYTNGFGYSNNCSCNNGNSCC